MKDEKSATQTRYAEKALDDLNDCWKKTQILPVKDPKIFVIGEELKKALMTISDWLDHFETCLFTVPPKKGIQQKLKENAVSFCEVIVRILGVGWLRRVIYFS